MKKGFKIYFKPDLLFVVSLFCLLVLTVLGAALGSVWLLLLALPLAAFTVFRVLSRNLAARAKENEIASRILLYLPRMCVKLYRRLFPDRHHAFASCPACDARLRFQRVKKGSFHLTCPRCKTRFPVHVK